MFYRQRVYPFKLLHGSKERLYFIKKILKSSMFLRIFYICITGSLDLLQRNVHFALTMDSVDPEYGGYWWLYRTFPPVMGTDWKTLKKYIILKGKEGETESSGYY